MMIVFDIETGPLPEEKIRPLLPPFDSYIAPFDQAAVKVGNLKDKDKIAAKIADARLAHAASVAGLADKQAAHEQDFFSRAALSALTGQVVAFGLKTDEGTKSIFHVSNANPPNPIHDEFWLLQTFWAAYEETVGDTWAGFNIFGFDLPFLIRRSWLCGVSVPDSIIRDKWWPACFIDLLDVWRCRNRGEYVKLDDLAKAIGLPGKPDGINGGDFARLLVEDPPTAMAYLNNDLDMTWAVATTLQVV